MTVDDFVKKRLNDGLPRPVLQSHAAGSGKDAWQFMI